MKTFTAVRALYGGILVAFPHRTFRAAAGRQPSTTEATVVRVLGARHVAQAAVCTGSPGRCGLVIGIAADLAHGASMLVLSGVDPFRRRPALVSASIAALGTTAGMLAARASARH